MSRWVFGFGAGSHPVGSATPERLGVKGANLHAMAGLGLPVPPGFVLSTEVCAALVRDGAVPDEVWDEVDEAIGRLETATGLGFGDGSRPLLVAVRSGASVSMPGMMDSVLNLGLNRDTLAGLARWSADERFAADCFRRFVQMYGTVVLGVDHHRFEDVLEQVRLDEGVFDDADLTAAHWDRVSSAWVGLIEADTGTAFAQDPREQLRRAVEAVFASWSTARARAYRRLHGIGPDGGTAVVVQQMVFGNRGERGGSGVCFTRDPSTGERVPCGEYLAGAQGEDVVSGSRTPEPVGSAPAPIRQALVEMGDVLERHFRDMQDLEFTVEDGALFLLQTRTGKRTAAASIRIAVAMVGEGLIGREEAVARIEAPALAQLLYPVLDPSAERRPFARGLAASPGAVTGGLVFDAAEAERQAAAGAAVVMVRGETSADDIAGLFAARGVLTTRGGLTSHAAVVARGLGRACVVGAGDVELDEAARTITAHGVTLGAGDEVTLDGATGEVFQGRVDTVPAPMPPDLATLMGWADAIVSEAGGGGGVAPVGLAGRLLAAQAVLREAAPVRGGERRGPDRPEVSGATGP